MRTLRDRSFESEVAGRPARRRRGRGSRSGADGSMDQVIKMHSASLTFLGLTLGAFISKKFFMLPLAVAWSLGQEYAKNRYLSRNL